MIDENGIAAQNVLTANLRRLRIARRLSLSQLARVTGVSKATLSGIENGRANPTLDTLAGLAAALQVPLGELLEAPALGDVRVVRTSHVAEEQSGDFVWRHIDAPALAGASELAEVFLAPRMLRDVAPLAPRSRAYVFVFQGKLIVGPIERITELGPGDYASFPTDVPHLYEAGRSTTRLLLISSSSA